MVCTWRGFIIVINIILFKCLMPQMCVNVMSESMLGVRMLLYYGNSST